MAKSSLISPRRRRFILLSSIVGLAAIVSPYAVPRLLRRFGLGFDLYRGPLVSKTDDLLGGLERREVNPEQFVSEVHQRFNEIDLEAEFNEWLDEPADHRGTRQLYTKWDATGHRQLMLFYIPPRNAHPPHAHHDVISAQCVLKGDVHVRQYERVARLDSRTLTLRPVSDTIFHPDDTILTTEYLNNVHWFGTNDHPAVVLNFNKHGAIENTFDGKSERPTGRYYVDPTTADRYEGTLIVAPEISGDEAKARFSRRALSEFASPTPLTSPTRRS